MPEYPWKTLHAENRSIVRATFCLAVALISAALIIAFVSYNYSFDMMVRSYEEFYLNKAHMIVNSVDFRSRQTDAEVLNALGKYWKTAKQRPRDEYICVVDKEGKLLLHTARPHTVGNYAGDNPIKGGKEVPEKTLCELVASQRDYVGKYVSSAGEDHIAAFVAVPYKNWLLGVHRSQSALQQQIRSGFQPLMAGFVIVCGFLMPIALFLLYRIFSRAQRREMAVAHALRESEGRYQSLIDTMPQGLYRTDLQSRITFANKAFAEWLKRPLEECLGKTAEDLYPEEMARKHLADDVQVIRTGSTLDVIEEYRIDGDGESEFIEIVRTPVFSADGETIGLQGIVWDVTGKMRAEKRLEQTKAQLEAVLHSVPSGIVAADTSGRLTLVNNKAEEILGLKAKEALGFHVTRFIPDSGLTKVISNRKREFGKPFSFGDKTLIVSRSPIYEDNHLIGAVSVFHDESELESVQKQLDQMKQLNDEFSSLVENSHDGVLITDRDTVLRVNPSFGRITGLAPSGLEGKKVEELNSENHICLATVKEVFHGVEQRGISVTLRRQLRSGHEIYVTGSPVKNQSGQVVRVVMNIRDVTELESLEEQIRKLSAAYLESQSCIQDSCEAADGIVAESQVTKNLLAYAMRVARVDSTVVLIGESGVGKDLLASLVHGLSNRAGKPYVSVNCGAIPETLLESEFFGYEKGAFSGADREGKPGLFEQASGGTLFLDEVGELPLNLQVKLLKVLHEQKCRRLGGVKTIDLDVRILAATNRDLKTMIETGEFREDLFYRLYVVPMEIPPLRQRKEDILPLALHFLKCYNQKYGVTRSLGQETLRILEHYDWPGNVRELQNVVERMVVTADSEVLEPRHLPGSLRPESGQADQPALCVPEGLKLREAKDLLERDMIQKALAQSRNTRDAAELLGVAHSTVVRKARKYGLKANGGEASSQMSSQGPAPPVN